MPAVNRQIVLAARPAGLPKESDFRLAESPVPEPAAGQALVRNLYVSVDPYMRGLISGAKTYATSVDLGQVMSGGAVAKVVASNLPALAVGDIVAGSFGWQDYALTGGDGVRKVDPSLAPVSTALGVLGMPGLTAYFGLLEIGRPKAGETVVISGAAGAVGSIVGQIARLKGCRTVGIAGSDEKVRWLTEDLGFDAAVNYKTARNLYRKLKEACPAGVDVYFDNVGGETTDALFRLINVGIGRAHV
jgi:NADPH-dependent curcumin reductase CurA